MNYTSPIGSRQPQTSGDAKITLIVARQADMFFGVQIALHEKFGLTTDALRSQFFAFLRSTNRIADDNPFSRWADLLRKDADIVKNLNACRNQPKCSIPFTVYEWFLTALREFGVDFVILPNGDVQVRGVNPKLDISQWTTTEKFIEVVKRAAGLLPANVGNELLALIDPLIIGIAVGVVAVWAVSHFFGVGEIADVVLLVVGYISIGPIAWRAGEHLINFSIKTVNGKKSEDLDEAAKDLSEAVALLGVQVVMALLLKKAPKVLRENPEYSTFNVRDLPKVKRPAGEWFYEPKTQAAARLDPGVLGETSIYGDIKYLSKLTGNLKNETILHERVHSFLTPKLYPLRNIRITLNWNGYAKSYLLRYLEEALAETAAQVGTYGFKNAIVGIKFPLRENYVTLAAMGVEARGIFLGPINVAGMTYRVYLTFESNR